VPALIDLAAELALIGAFIFAYAALQGYRFSFSPLLNGVAWLLQHFAVSLPLIGRVGPGPWLARELHKLDKIILNALAAGVDVTEGAIVGLWNGTAALFELLGRELEGLARDTANALSHIGAVPLHAVIKAVQRLIAASVNAAYRRLLKLLGIATHGLGARIIQLLHRAVAIEHELRDVVGYTRRNLRALIRRLGRYAWLAGIASLAALGHLVFKRLHLRWLIGYRTLAALGIGILARLGLQWTRCGNTTKAGKGVCGLDGDLLDLLLLDTLGILGAISLVEFTHDVQDITDASVSIMRGFIREF
jgi:hypothetical protein